MERVPVRAMIAAGAAAVILALLLVPQLKAANPNNSDVLMQVLGGTADLAAAATYNEANLYFHGGVAGGCPDEAEHGECKGHSAAEEVHADLPLIGLIEYLHGEMAPKEHRHLERADEKELLPWFEATVRLDPNHIEAWRNGAYWYHRTGEGEKAVEFISKGIGHNPKEYRLYMDRGALYNRLSQWDKSIQDLETAKRLWKNDSDDSKFDARAINTYLNNSREHLSQR